MPKLNAISPCLWFDKEAEEAAHFYTLIFPESRIVRVTHYPDFGRDHQPMPPGTVMFVDFELAGQRFAALNAGPHFKFTPAISLMVSCDTQDELDRYWELLSAGGDPSAQMCGWLSDRFGLSWQIVPAELGSWFDQPDVTARVTTEVMKMKKLDIATLRQAAAG